MNNFVLDNSVAMRWIMPTQKQQDQNYAEAVLLSFKTSKASVPMLWHLEVINVLREAEKAEHLNHQQTLNFIKELDHLPIEVPKDVVFQNSLHYMLSLSCTFKLSAYDAAYLALAISLSLPLATLDKALIKAAQSAEVAIYTP